MQNIQFLLTPSPVAVIIWPKSITPDFCRGHPYGGTYFISFIAKTLGVSGTVLYRALYGKPGVSPAVAALDSDGVARQGGIYIFT